MQDIIIDDFAFELPLSNYDGKDFVIWGRKDKISQGDVLNGELRSSCSPFPPVMTHVLPCQTLRSAMHSISPPNATLHRGPGFMTAAAEMRS